MVHHYFLILVIFQVKQIKNRLIINLWEREFKRVIITCFDANVGIFVWVPFLFISVLLNRTPHVMVHVCVCVFPHRPCAALIRGTLIIVWPHGCPSSLGEEAETGEGCWAVRQHPAASHLSCHLCYSSHGILCVRPVEDKAGWSQLSRMNSPPLICLDLNTNTDKQKSSGQIWRERSGDAEWGILDHRNVYSCKDWRLIFTALFAQACVGSLYVNLLSMIHSLHSHSHLRASYFYLQEEINPVGVQFLSSYLPSFLHIP